MYSTHYVEKYAVSEIFVRNLTLFRMGLFGTPHGGGKKALLPKICHTYPAWCTLPYLTIVVPYL